MLERLSALFRHAPVNDSRAAARPAQPAPKSVAVDEKIVAETRLALDTGLDNAGACDLLARELPIDLREQLVNAVSDKTTLREIALTDRMARVRLAAARRLHDDADLEILRRSSTDKAVSRHARETLRARREQVTCNERARQHGVDLLADLQAHARHPLEPLYDARLATLHKAWQAMPESALDDQQRAAGEAAISQARARVQALLDEQRHQAQRTLANEELQAACRELEDTMSRLSREDWSTNVAAVNALLATQQTRWQEASAQVAPADALARRMQHAVTTLTRWRDAAAELPRVADAAADLLQAIDEADHPADQLDTWDEQHQSLTAQLAWPDGFVRPPLADALAAVGKRIAAWRNAQRADVAATLRHLKGRRNALRRMIEDGQLRAAIRLHHWLEARISTLPPAVCAAEREAMAPVTDALARLQDWYAFASTPKKIELCSAMEALADSDMEATVRSDAVRHLREAWNALCAANPEADTDLRVRFDTAAERAWAPCAAWHAAQHALRQTNLQARRTLCLELDALLANVAGGDVDWRATEQEARRLRESWRTHEPVPWPDARDVQQHFRSAMAQLHEHIDSARKHGLATREALLNDAEQLAASTDTVQALHEARRLQDAWKAAPWAPHKPAQAIWQRFRVALDAIHARRDAERDADRRAQEAARHAAREQRTAEQTREREHQQARRQARIALWQLALDIDVHEHRFLAGEMIDPTPLARALDAQAPSTLRDALLGRLARLANPGDRTAAERPENTAARAAYLLDLEIALDLPSPDALSTERLARRVELLNNSLRGVRPDDTALNRQLDDCLAIGPVIDTHGEQARRLQQIIAARQGG